MGIFKRANEVIDQARRDVAKPKRDELSVRRQQKQQGGRK
jgi:hypothetical protein